MSPGHVWILLLEQIIFNLKTSWWKLNYWLHWVHKAVKTDHGFNKSLTTHWDFSGEKMTVNVYWWACISLQRGDCVSSNRTYSPFLAWGQMESISNCNVLHSASDLVQAHQWCHSPHPCLLNQRRHFSTWNSAGIWRQHSAARLHKQQ